VASPRIRLGAAARAGAAVLLAGFALLLGAGTAWAHNVLTSTDPPNGANLATGPSTVTLTFDLPVKRQFSTITVVGPDGLHFEGGPSAVNGNVVSAPVRPLGPAGGYTVGYRIVSDDGHPVSGAVHFNLTRAGTGQGVPAEDAPGASADTGGSAEGSGSTGPPIWAWVLVAVALVAAGATVALRAGRGADD
jgi:hypothetical protein